MRILVFVAKDVGYRCLKYLLTHFPHDHYECVVGHDGATPIIDLLKEAEIPYHLLSAQAITDLHAYPPKTFDWLLSLWNGHIFTAQTLSLAQQSLNIHPSYLPYGRGRDPVVWALRHREPAGVTLHKIAVAVDQGDIFSQRQVPYRLPCRGGDLYQRVLETCVEHFQTTWPDIRIGQITPHPQTKETVTHYRRDLWSDQVINCDQNPMAFDVVSKLLAHDFGKYRAQIKLDNTYYHAELILTPVTDDVSTQDTG